MGAISIQGDRMGLRAAANIIARKAKEIVRQRPNSTRAYIGSKKIPRTINSYLTAGFSENRTIAYVSAGGAGGLEAPNAYMFETRGARHPLFAHGPPGTDGWLHWYDQPFFGFLEDAAEQAGQEACERYADIAIQVWARESGYR
jgi:hypothetical protein